MLRRPRGRGPWSSNNPKFALAVALLLAPWIQIASAGDAPPELREQELPLHPAHQANQLANDATRPFHDDSTVAAIEVVAGTECPEAAHGDPGLCNKQSASSRPMHPQHARNYRRTHKTSDKNDIHHNDQVTIPNDASALATLAPALPVRAPHPQRRQWPRSATTTGLTSPHVARSLEDWEVEDFVLLATVDGDLYASDRRTGTELWHLEVDQPMIETSHHRANSSLLDEDYDPIDHYVWAVEPTLDGGLYVWIPDSGIGLARTSFTMKRLVEDLAPFADENPPVVYTGDKKTTLVTIDAATGQVLKWFGSGGSHVNEEESCLRPNTLYNMDATECSSTGTITIGRTEYTVGIQRRDGRPIATLKYAEWVPNNYDNDLYQQHHTSLDSRYITSQHDGKVYAFDYNTPRAASPKFTQRFSAPVARVFDVCRPWDAPPDSKPELVVLPQPPMPSHDEDMARIRSNSIFLNQTDSGSWYAMSGRSYPLIIDAPVAKASGLDWKSDTGNLPGDIGWGLFTKSLVGTHRLESPVGGVHQPATLPASAMDGALDEPDNQSYLPVLVPEDSQDAGIVDKVKSLPQSAANSIMDFISNPTLIIVFIVILIANENKLRRAYQRFRAREFLKRFLHGDQLKELKTDELAEHDKKLEPASLEPQATSERRIPQTEEKILDGKGESPRQEDQEGIAMDGSPAEPGANGLAAEAKKKKAHRGRRGGVKHRKGKTPEPLSRPDDPVPKPLDDAVSKVMRLGGEPRSPGMEPNVMTVQPSDMQAVGEPIMKMGNIEVNTEVQLGSGSNGTLVFAGRFDGRDVAVKRMLIHFYDIASQETRLLRESDDHPNVIRYYSQQAQDGFLYIALERCAASLAEVVEKPHAFRELANAGRQDVPAVLYQITNGINHLHSLRIVHRDLKPQNILVNMGKNGKPRMLVSDFGLCKKLEDTQSSFGATTGRAAGTSGWRAPELLLDDDADGPREGDMDTTNSGSGTVLVQDAMTPNNRRATRAIDIFSLGLVFYYVLTNGLHPFDCGDRYMREVNIRNGKFNLQPLDSLGDFAHEAKDLISSMLCQHPKDRPSTADIMSHPFFWSPKKRLAFLCDVSDHFEKEQRDPPSPCLAELESRAAEVTHGDFLRHLPREFVDSLGRQRKYVGSKFLDLLRALRNKRNHYEDMPDSLKRTVGALPEGYLSFWTVRFPMLLLVCWNVVWEVGWDKSDRFREYYLPAGL